MTTVQKLKNAAAFRGKNGGVNPLWSLVFIALLGIGVYYGGVALGLWNPLGAAPGDDDASTAAEPTQYIINIYDYLDSANDDEMADDETNLTWYEYDYSEVDAEDIDDTLADLLYADLTADGSDATKTPEDDHAYLLKIDGDDVVTQWWSTDVRLFEGKLPLLVLGDNDIYMMNFTEDVSMLCYDTNSQTTTINQTNYDKWSITLNCLDAAEGVAAEITDKEGYLPYYDPSLLEDISPVIEIQFNTTASSSWCELESGYENREKASGNYLYIEVDVVLYDTTTLEIDFSSLLGSSFEVIGIVVSYGYAESNTNWDTQN